MTTITITDRVSVQARDVTPEGYLRVRARIARTGVQIYRAWEMGMAGDGEVRIYRPPEEVFAADSLASWAACAITDGHPPGGMVTADNWARYARGVALTPGTPDGDHVAADLLVTDAAAAARAKAAELSCGYTFDLDRSPGTTPQGEAYDGIQRRIRGNHVAIVDNARCGPTCRIGDCTGDCAECTCSKRGPVTMTTRTITVDGISIETTDQGAQVIERLGAQLRETRAAADAAAGRHAAEMQAKDGEIAALKAQIPDAAAMDRAIAERASVIESARKMVGDALVTDGRTLADIRAQAVTARLGADAVAGRAPEYVAAAFDTLARVTQGSQPDPLRAAVAQPAKVATDARADAIKARDEYLRNAWRGAPATGNA